MNNNNPAPDIDIYRPHPLSYPGMNTNEARVSAISLRKDFVDALRSAPVNLAHLKTFLKLNVDIKEQLEDLLSEFKSAALHYQQFYAKTENHQRFNCNHN